MLTNEVKNRINTCRDILVGKLPDPKSQVLQITNALIYKFMDDQDRKAERLTGKPSFFINGLEGYAWHKLFDTKLSNQERADKYIEGIEKLSKAEHLPLLFQQIFKEAYVPFRAAGTIVMFIDEINRFDYTHNDDLGNAYEYLLSIMGSQGDAGQFRTPRHIIKFLVDVVNPQRDETIFDPAAGTAGFLIAAYTHILEENKKLTPTHLKKLSENISGVDISPDMAKMARVNLYLHGFATPNIEEGDTLSDEGLWEKKYDVILANPPFMSPKGGIVPHNKFSFKTSRSEVLFADYIAEHLKLTGRAGMIVPEGIIFQSGASHKALRKMLVENNYLYAVISLPAGVFQPYSGVKTSILIMDRERAKESDEVLFLKIENDGYTTGTQRHEREGDQLPEALAVARAWQEKEKKESKLAVWVTKKEIAKTSDYNLSVDRYRLAVDYAGTKWPMVKLGEICNVLNGYAFRSNLFNKQNIGVPVIRIRDVNSGFSETYYSGEYDEKYVVNNEDLLIGMDGDFVATLWKNGRALLNQRVCRLQDFKGVDKKYIYFLIQKELSAIQEITYAVTVKHLSSTQIEKIKIPLPPLEIQEGIVAELDGYAGIIAGAKQIVQNWKPKIDIDPKWKKVKISEICKIERGGSPRPIDKFITKDPKGFNWVKIGDTKKSDKYINQTAERITKEGVKKSRKVLVGDFVLSNSMSFGRPYIMKIEGYIHDGWLRLSEDFRKIGKDYLYYILSSDIVMKQFENAATGGVVRNLNSELVRNVMIPLPPLEIQEQIVEIIEDERELVESSKKLIEIYEQKTKDVIAKLWAD